MTLQIELDWMKFNVPAVIGRHRCTCPQCSATREKQLEKCMVVDITEDGFRWFCHHCAWDGSLECVQ